MENQGSNFWLDPYRDIIGELVRSYGEDSSDSWPWANNVTDVVTVHKDDTPGRRILILFERGGEKHRRQLFILRTNAFDFELFAYLGNLNDEQASYMNGFLAGYLADDFWPGGPMPMDFSVCDHNLDSWMGVYGERPREPFEDNEKLRAFSEFLDEGHWAHLVGLRTAAARHMTEYIALKLVFDTWSRFVQAIRGNHLKIVPDSYSIARPVIEKVERFLDLNPGMQVDRNIDNWKYFDHR